MSFEKIGELCNLGKYGQNVASDAFHTACKQLDKYVLSIAFILGRRHAESSLKYDAHIFLLV